MKYKTQVLTLTGFIYFMFVSLAVSAPNKSIYIKSFVVQVGLSKTDPIGERIKDYISEEIISRGGYSLTSDEEVKQVMTQEEIQMSLETCYDDACIKKLMESLRTDYIVYGNVSFEEGRYHITAKMLDRSSGTVKLARVKSLQFKDKNKLKMASADLANYLTEGKEIEMNRYDDAYRAVTDTYEKKVYEKNVPVGLSVYYMYFIPSKSPFKDYYSSLMGGGLDYYHKINYYISLAGGFYYVRGSDDSGKVNVSLNSYSITGRAGYPLYGFVYPYISLASRFTWFNESSSRKSTNFIGYGGDASLGCSFIVWRTLALWGDYSVSIVKLNDKGSNDISGSAIRVGVMYSF